MAFDMGFNFRSTAGYVTDPAYGVPVLVEAYPHTYTASNGYSINAGYVAGTTGAGANRSATNDPRIAGINYDYTAAAGLSFHADLSSGSAPGAGTYTIDLACGDANQSRGYATIKVKDNTTDLISLSGTTGGANKYFDATGAIVTATTSWTGATASKTFASTTAYLNTTVSSDIGCLAHFRLTLAGPASYTLTAAVGALSLSGKAARTLATRRLNAAKGTAAMTERVANLRASRRLIAATGPLGLTGAAVGVRATRQLVGATGTLTLTGQPALRGVARRLLATTGTLALLGPDVTITKGGVLYRLTAATGALTVTGVDAAVLRAGRLLAAQGAFTLTGRAARLRYVTAGGDFHHERRDTTQPFRRHWT